MMQVGKWTVILFAVILTRMAVVAGERNVLYVRADQESIIVEVPAGMKQEGIQLFSAYPFEPLVRQEKYSYSPVQNGIFEGGEFRFPRYQNGEDYLYRHFAWANRDGKTLTGGAYVVDMEPGVEKYHGTLLRPEEIKGISCVLTVADAVNLGCRYIHENISLNRLLALDAKIGEQVIEFEFNGEIIPFRAGYVQAFDRKFKEFYENGIAVFLVFYNEYSSAPENLPLRHPGTISGSPMVLGAFNTTSMEGVKYYTAALEFLMDRYCRPDGKYGQISSLIIGNEVQQHAIWYNMGEVPYPEVARAYADALRIADHARMKYNPDLRVYVSLEHHWTLGSKKSLQAVPGETFLSELNQVIQSEGDFPWNLAFHPYPENLFNPRFWLDRSAKNRLDTPRITFRNLEQLVANMSQEKYLYRGKIRDIALTEQGFHLESETPEGEAVQAAAYAYAYKRIKALHPYISAFILHRHVDHLGEGGLLLGVWNHDMTKKRRMYEVFQAAGTDDEEKVFSFALPVIGIQSFEEMPELKENYQSIFDVPEEYIVYDFVENLPEAGQKNNMAVESRDILRSAGWLTKGIFQHPPRDGWGHVSFELEIPALEGWKMILGFETMVGHTASDGVNFRVFVDDLEVCKGFQKGEKPNSQMVDLTEFSGKNVKIDFQVEKGGNVDGDWFYWLQPALLKKKSGID